MTRRTDHAFCQTTGRADGPASDRSDAPLVSLRFNQLAHGPSPWLLNYRFHSKTHILVWRAPTYILPALAGLLYWIGWPTACAATVAFWLAWFFLSPPLIGLAIRTWGERFWFFDFSRNTHPTPLERRIAEIGLVGPVLLSLAVVVGALIADGFREILPTLGGGLALAVFLAVFGSFVVPFLIVVFTGFKVRPVIDDGEDEVVSVMLQGRS